MFHIHNMGFDTRRFDKIYSKNLIKSWHIMSMKSNPGGIGGKIMLQNQGTRPESF